MDKLRFLLVLHNHQPLGNFDDVIQGLMDKAYRPFLEAIRSRPALKLTLHVSGPLLLWLEHRASDYLDLVGGLVQRGPRGGLGVGGFKGADPSGDPLRGPRGPDRSDARAPAVPVWRPSTGFVARRAGMGRSDHTVARRRGGGICPHG